MDQASVNQVVARVFDLMGKKLGVGGATLEARVRRAGRVLPRPVRRAARELVQAEKMARSPQLVVRLDGETVGRAYETCLRHLKEIDPVAETSRRRYNLAATIAFQVIVVVGLGVALLWWRGFL